MALASSIACSSTALPPDAPLPPEAPPETAAIAVAVPEPAAATAAPHEPAVPLHAARPSLLPSLASARKVSARIETDLGNIECTLFRDKAPLTVENFVGLASGEKEWKDPRSGQWSNEPMYDGTSFHRVIPGFMIQGGDPKGDSTGEPGFVFNDEIWAGAKHDRPGLLCMANRGPNTNGGQFFITDASAPHLDGGYTIFGECSPVSVIHSIASTPAAPNARPQSRVGIRHVEISIQ